MRGEECKFGKAFKTNNRIKSLVNIKLNKIANITKPLKINKINVEGSKLNKVTYYSLRHKYIQE